MTKAHDWAAYGKQGGLERARRLSRKKREEIARQAVLARHARSSKKDRSEGARQAALARWARPRAEDIPAAKTAERKQRARSTA